MKKLIIALAALITLGSSAHADPPATHGMLFFGDKAMYVSHLPMFYSPHDYQFIAEVEIIESNHISTIVKYKEAKAEGQKLFTIDPIPFNLTQMIDGKLKMLSAVLYSGHFEQGGSPLGPIQVKIKKFIFAKKLDPNENETLLDHIVFGGDGEFFAAHVIKGKPSFDSVLKVTEPVEQVFCRTRNCQPNLSAQLPFTVHNAIADGIAKPLSEGDLMGGVFGPQAEVLDVLYLEENELAH